MTTAAIISTIIFGGTFALILTERVHRSVVAMAGAVLMVLAGIIFDFYHPEDALNAVDFNTLGLLFGMMLLVVVLERTGVFQYLGILTAKKTKGNPWLLMLALGTLTAVLSMILDNVTTIILIVPITIIIARMLKISATPLLLVEAMLSNVGGTATLVGDPPNIMIGSAADFTFNAFLVHSLPTVLVVGVVTFIMFRFLFKKELSKAPENIEELMQMNEKDAITDLPTLKKGLAVLAGVVVLFFFHGVLHLEASLIALIGAAAILLLVTATKDPQPIIEKTELSVLLFFASLFITVGGLEHAGVLESLAQIITASAESNLLLTAIIILWVAAIASAIVDNIPLTVAMIPIILYLQQSGVPVDLLWWALVFGVGFGGNGSPIGSTAGIIVVSKSEQTDEPISFKRWLKYGIPATAAGLSIASVVLVIFYYTGFVTV
ncbi:ArsB/NhaD family transporter [Candidatus Kaiserbacteria bacterium]|nr:MAG: ArsB/NhaD family transporter [Candidatus Kaiserbacteria bacterium]